MDKLAQYRKCCIKKILTEYYEMTNTQTSKICYKPFQESIKTAK